MGTQSQSPVPPYQPRRILVRGVNWLGDAVMTTPALLRLRERFPDAFIALLSPEKLRDLWLHHPAIDEVTTFKSDEGVLRVARKIRMAKASDAVLPFDLALVLPNSPRSAIEAWLARIPQRVGYLRPWRNVFLTTRVPARPDAEKMRKRSVEEIKRLIETTNPPRTTRHTPRNTHQIHDYLHLVAALGANPEPLPPQLIVTPDEITTVAQKFNLRSLPTDPRPIFGLNPGAEYGPAKRWLSERFIAAAREIQRRTNCFWLIFGGKGDVSLANEIASAIDAGGSAARALAGQTSLRELCALLKFCRVLLTNDTGPMHVAAALGTPVVVPFGSTSPEFTGPIQSGSAPHELIKSDAPCAPCFLRECPIDFRCMNGIAVEQVVEAVLRTVA